MTAATGAIIGTAGHVDHGKTLLIRAMTGMETDRLAEEKKRGITIELGFAYLTLPNGEKAGIVDVPGHERFVRNMLAGAGSIDLAMLVVAADEGIMPQTREHLAILGHLGIKQGLVVVNKIDLVDEDWLAMVILDIEEELATTFLANAPIMPVSAYTGAGIEALRQEIFTMLVAAPAKNTAIPFRLPVDRVFTMDGFGTVVTGTLIEGTLELGQDVMLYPSLLTAKARRIQVHGELAERAVAGQRVAVNLAGLKVSDINKGDVLAAVGSLENSRILDVAIEINKDCERSIRHNSRLHLHHGTRDVLCTLSLPETAEIAAGGRAYGQLRLAEPLAAKLGDRFVLRFYSPTETIGGGTILDPLAKRLKGKDKDAVRRLEIKEKGELAEQIEVIFAEAGLAFDFLSREYVERRYFTAKADFDNALTALLASGKLVVAGDVILHESFVTTTAIAAQEILAAYHKANPLHGGMALRELCGRLLPHNANRAEDVVKCLAEHGSVRLTGQEVAHPDFKPTASEAHSKIGAAVLETYLQAGFVTPAYDEVADNFVREKRAFVQAFEALVKSGDLIALTPQIHAHAQIYDKALEIVRGLAADGKELTLADFRDAIGASRKYALAFLEHFDKKGITRKLGDVRVLK